MSDVDKSKRRRTFVKGTITSKLNQLQAMFGPEAAASLPSETFFFFHLLRRKLKQLKSL